MDEWEKRGKTIYGLSRQRMSEGGRLLDQGMYGCVFTPSLTCRPGTEQRVGEEESPSQALSKLLPVEEAEKELDVARRVVRIPFYKQYFAVAESICKPAPLPQQREKEREIGRCDILSKESIGDMRLLRMSYAGKALHQARLSAQTFDLRGFMTHLVAGGALMNLFGVVHRDLHQGNILVDSYQVPRIIDFNLSIPVRGLGGKGVHAADLSHKYDIGISQEPADSTLVNAVAHGESASSVIQAICFRKPIINKLVALLGVSKQGMYRDLLTFYKRSKSMRSGDLERWFSLYHRVVDSWAIGVIIVELVMTLSLWPSFARRIQGQVQELLPILRKMCAITPTDRIDCVQALRSLDPNHVIIRRYGMKWLEIVDQKH